MQDKKLTFAQLEQHKKIETLGQQLKGKSNTERNQFLNDEFHLAIKNNKLLVAEYLLKIGVDINCQDIEKHTPLMVALKSKQVDAVKWLLARGALVSGKNIYNFTALHYAKIMRLDSEVEKLLLETGGKALLNEENIYGKTALDYQTGIDFDKTIHQKNILARIKSYLDHHKRENFIKSEAGICCALSFMFLMYARQGRADYFFNTLKLIANWDGSEEGLSQTFSYSMPQSKFYINLDELLGQWINDVVVFQKGLPSLEKIKERTTWKNQLRRFEQFELVREKNRTGNIQFLYQWKPSNPDRASEFQIRELLEVFHNMPIGTCLEIGGGGHVTSIYINEDRQLMYYDSLFIDKVPASNDVDSLLALILNTKYQGLGVSPSDPGGFVYQLYYFSQDKNNFKHYDVSQLITTLNAINNRELKAKKIGMLILGGVGALLGIGIIVGAILLPTSLPLLVIIPLAASLALATTGIGIWLGLKISSWINGILEQYSLKLREKEGTVSANDVSEMNSSYQVFKTLGPSARKCSPPSEDAPLAPKSVRTMDTNETKMKASETKEPSSSKKLGL